MEKTQCREVSGRDVTSESVSRTYVYLFVNAMFSTSIYIRL
jgi:hypothetical protein